MIVILLELLLEVSLPTLCKPLPHKRIDLEARVGIEHHFVSI